MMRAAEYGHVQCMEELANAKADMKCRDLEGKGNHRYTLFNPSERSSGWAYAMACVHSLSVT